MRHISSWRPSYEKLIYHIPGVIFITFLLLATCQLSFARVNITKRYSAANLCGSGTHTHTIHLFQERGGGGACIPFTSQRLFKGLSSLTPSYSLSLVSAKVEITAIHKFLALQLNMDGIKLVVIWMDVYNIEIINYDIHDIQTNSDKDWRR